MKILGVNKGQTSSGKKLRDGGLAFISEGIIEAVFSEEKVSRRNRKGGFDDSLSLFKKLYKIDEEEIDYIAVSTCCETIHSSLKNHELSKHPGIKAIGHHESHAWGAYSLSGFEDALVVVIDGGGQTFEEPPDGEWWRVPREQHSYFIASSNGIQLVDRDFDQPFDVGFGEIYRAASYFLGWPSSKYSGKVMALSSHGNYKNISSKKIYEVRDGKLIGFAMYNSSNPAEIIRSLGNNIGVFFGEPIYSGCMKNEISRGHIDLAAYIQWNVENALIDKIKWLVKKTGLSKICLTGGFFLNCVANGRLFEEIKCNDIYVPPAPSDHGQCLGNAAALWYNLSKKRIMPVRKSSHCYLGPKSNLKINSSHICDSLVSNELKSAVIMESETPEKSVATIIAHGNVTAVYQGRSEYGLRALGNRSILMLSDSLESHSIATKIKNREWFQPFAPAISDDRFQQIFENCPCSPFMSFAFKVPEEKKGIFKSTISKSDRARVQSVDAESFLGRVLVHLYEIKGCSVCLNTSFNRKNEPIVESVDDAVASFKDLHINALSIDNFIVLKLLGLDIIESGLIDLRAPFSVQVFNGDEKSKLIGNDSTVDSIRWLQKYFDSVVFIRSYFSLFVDYLDWLKAGKKNTTIRWRRNGIEFPAKALLPLRCATDENRAPSITSKPSEWVKIAKVEYKYFGDLTEADAKKDGFDSLQQLQSHFKNRIYPEIADIDWVTIYHLEVV